MQTITAYTSQEKFIEVAEKWHAEYGDMPLHAFFDTENTSTPIMLHKRFIVSKMIATFLRSNGVYPGAKNTFVFIGVCDGLEEYSMEIPTEDTEEIEEDTFDYSEEYDEIDLGDCTCF